MIDDEWVGDINLTMKILRFHPAFLPFLSLLFRSSRISHVKKTALPAGQKSHMDFPMYYPARSRLYASRTLLVLTVT